MKSPFYLLVFVPVLVSLACSLAAVPPASLTPMALTVTPNLAPTVQPAADATLPAAVASLPSGSGPCLAASSSEVTVYARPSLQADIFSSIVLSTPAEVISRTADGWLGFEPGVAQAANIGNFRQRWNPAGAPIFLSVGCARLPVAEWVPKPGVCYEMAMSPVEVHAAADSSSAVKATLAVGDFAAILGVTSTGWVSISGDQANRPGVAGFISVSDMNVNGPCNAIPAVPG